jgi:hypothetical protein
MAGAGQQEVPEEPEVRVTQQESPEEPEVGGAQEEAPEGSLSDVGQDWGGQP